VTARIHFSTQPCSLGHVLVAQSALGICAILLGDDHQSLENELKAQFPAAECLTGKARPDVVVDQVLRCIETPACGLLVPLDMQGTAFQKRIWNALREIPPATTVSYTELAARIGQASAVRAVARACAANRIAVAIPCHRVVRRNGDLAGYRWGVERKRELLRREAQWQLANKG
jgi:AraC family transcriptional regulator of adaptative response/methylated-DNA-[protein]-cysteine methyltransferase